MRNIMLSLLMLPMLIATAQAAESKGDAVAGKRVAESVCRDCHDVTGNKVPRSPPGNAPPFITLAQSPDQTEQKLRRYLTLPHGRMINLLVTGKDRDNVVSYILSLRSQNQ